MNILAIDTSNHVMGVAVVSDGKVIGEVITNLKKNHSVRLMPTITSLMEEIGMQPEELNQIAVAQGPGSYTGVRIGVTTAKTLAWSLEIPIVGVSSIEVLAYQGRFYPGEICTFFDARRQTVFAGVYAWEKHELIEKEDERNILMQEWLDELANKKQEVLFLSPDIALYEEMIKTSLGDLAIIPESVYHIAKPSDLAFASIGRQADDVHTLTPNYLRLAEAEANWLKAQKDQA